MESARKESLSPQPRNIYELTIRAWNVTLEIIEASEGKIKIKSNCAGQVTDLCIQEVTMIPWKQS
jgi:hypothetical protein